MMVLFFIRARCIQIPSTSGPEIMMVIRAQVCIHAYVPQLECPTHCFDPYSSDV